MFLKKGKFPMKNNLQSIQLDIQYVTDDQGNQIFVQIPFAQWQMIYLKLIEEEDQIEELTEPPELVDKQGVLVVRAKQLRHLMNITRCDVPAHRLGSECQRIVEVSYMSLCQQIVEVYAVTCATTS
jgi:hypothetical protein